MDDISDFDRHHITEILQDEGGRYSWFSAHLIRLITHADDGNRARIRSAFPEHVEAYEDWYYQRGFYAPKTVNADA